MPTRYRPMPGHLPHLTRQHGQKQIDRAVRAHKLHERDHREPAAQTYERQV